MYRSQENMTRPGVAQHRNHFPRTGDRSEATLGACVHVWKPGEYDPACVSPSIETTSREPGIGLKRHWEQSERQEDYAPDMQPADRSEDRYPRAREYKTLLQGVVGYLQHDLGV
jgi:hypothetical protein